MSKGVVFAARTMSSAQVVIVDKCFLQECTVSVSANEWFFKTFNRTYYVVLHLITDYLFQYILKTKVSFNNEEISVFEIFF